MNSYTIESSPLKPLRKSLFLFLFLFSFSHLNFAQITRVGQKSRVNTTTLNSQRNAKAAMDNDGNYLVVWESFDEDGDGWGVYGQWYNADRTSNGASFKANPITEHDQRNPAVAVGEDGSSIIVWEEEEEDGSGFSLKFSSYDDSHSSVVSGTTIRSTQSGQQRWPDVDMDANGTSFITWTQVAHDNSTYTIFVQKRLSNGSATSSPIQINDNNNSFNGFSKIAVEQSGDMAITWQSLGSDTTGTHGIMLERLDQIFTSLGSESLVNTEITGNQYAPDVAMDSVGNFTVVWTSAGQDGDGDGIYGQHYFADGSSNGVEFQVNTNTTGFQNYPSIGMSKTGAMAIGWNSYDQSSDYDGAFAQAYHSDGSQNGLEYQIEYRSNSFQQFPSIAAKVISDSMIFVWADGFRNSTSTLDGSDYGVYSAKIGVAGPLAATFTVNNISCHGIIDGSIIPTVSNGIAPLTYAWSNGPSTKNNTNLSAGTYTLTITDFLSATIIDSVTITEPDSLVADVFIVEEIVCAGDDNGHLIAYGFGGSMPYAFLWSSGGTDATDTNLVAGNYTVTITDASGCSDTASANLIANDTIPPVASTQNITVYLNGSGKCELYSW